MFLQLQHCQFTSCIFFLSFLFKANITKLWWWQRPFFHRSVSTVWSMQGWTLSWTNITFLWESFLRCHTLLRASSHPQDDFQWSWCHGSPWEPHEVHQFYNTGNEAHCTCFGQLWGTAVGCCDRKCHPTTDARITMASAINIFWRWWDASRSIILSVDCILYNYNHWSSCPETTPFLFTNTLSVDFEIDTDYQFFVSFFCLSISTHNFTYHQCLQHLQEITKSAAQLHYQAYTLQDLSI